ncbi:MAG: hypothetical protein QHI38_08275 [Armatimonadota bacterium]|nr:hypothetical protein [Armatimonadota bacterium]
MAVETVEIQGGKPEVKVRFESTRCPEILLAMDPQNPRCIRWTPIASKSVEIRASIRFLRYPDIKSVSPIVDRYGQLRCADWHGKVKRDQDITGEILREEKTASFVGRITRL